MGIIDYVKSWVAPEPMIRFKCDIPGYEVGQPIMRAIDVKPDWMVKQLKQAERTGEHKFSACPGMHDYYKTGYIVPAWEDFEILVSKTKASIKIGTGDKFVCQPHSPMDYRSVAGAIDIDDNIKPHALKLPSPWKVFTKPGYSAFVLPAMYHSPFLRDIFVYPGINDYESFHSLNLMFSPLKEMHIKIYAGTPLMHIIPYKRETITAEVGEITRYESKLSTFTFRSKAPGYYRKWFYKKKTTEIVYIKEE